MISFQIKAKHLHISPEWLCQSEIGYTRPVVILAKMREMDKILWPILVRSMVQPAIDLIMVYEWNPGGDKIFVSVGQNFMFCLFWLSKARGMRFSFIEKKNIRI